MKTYSSENIEMKIECFIDSALKKEITLDILASVIDNMTPTLEKSKEVIRILLEIIHEEEKPIDKELQIKESNGSMDQNPTIIATEEKVNKSIDYSTSDGRNCQVNDQFLESFVEGTEDSSISLENNSENGKVSLETLADFSTDILCLN